MPLFNAEPEVSEEQSVVLQRGRKKTWEGTKGLQADGFKKWIKYVNMLLNNLSWLLKVIRNKVQAASAALPRDSPAVSTNSWSPAVKKQQWHATLLMVQQFHSSFGLLTEDVIS